jgi:hypothetical protein
MLPNLFGLRIIRLSKAMFFDDKSGLPLAALDNRRLRRGSVLTSSASAM